MANRSGAGIGKNSFERRRLPPRKRKREPLTAGDRLVLALFGGLLGLILWSVLYLILALIGVKVMNKVAALPPQVPAAPPIDPMGHLPPYSWGSWPALAFAAYGSLVGAERMMDAFEWFMEQLGEFARAGDRDD